MEFRKLSTGKVIVTDSKGYDHAFPPGLFVHPHPDFENHIMISDDANPQEVEKAFIFDYRQVTIPEGVASRNEMIEALCNGYFYDSQVSVGMGYVENMIISGKEFHITDFVTLANGGVIRFGFRPGDKHTRLKFFFSSTTEIEMAVYKNAVYSGGTAVQARNSNDISDNTPLAQVVANPAVSSNGSRWFGISAGKSSSPDVGGFFEPWDFIVMKPNTYYLFEFTNKDTTTNKFSYSATWSEE